MRKMIMVSGAAASGKSALLKYLLPYIKQEGHALAVAKMDCLESEDQKLFKKLGFPCVTGLSEDICPDHFLVSNLPELWSWAEEQKAEYLFIESAGLCHRCSPATAKTISIVVVDATANVLSPKRMGPMVAESDVLILSKCDLVSQAEREILTFKLKEANPKASIFTFDGKEGYGAESVGEYILSIPTTDSYEEDILRHTMPSGVCSYCVGERRVGSNYQLGVVGKIDFSRAE